MNKEKVLSSLDELLDVMSYCRVSLRNASRRVAWAAEKLAEQNLPEKEGFKDAMIVIAGINEIKRD